MQVGAPQGVDLVEDAQPALHHQTQFPACAARQAVNQRGALFHERARPARVIGQQARGGGRGLQRGQRGAVHAVGGAVGVCKVVAPARNVHAQVLPEVDELQGGADGVALRQGLGIRHAIQVQQQPPHGVGRAAAVVEQGGAVGVGGAVAGFLGVLHEGAEQVVEQRHGQAMLAQHALQRAEHGGPARAGRRPRGHGGQLGAVGGQVAQALGRHGVALVGDVIGRARKGVQRGNGRAQVRRAQQRGHGKVLVVRHGRRRGGRGRGQGGWGRGVHGTDCRRARPFWS